MFDWSVKTTNAFIQRYIETWLRQKGTEEKASEDRKYVFLDVLAASGASDAAIRGQMLSIILGGRDTTAATLSFLFWHLARRPDVVAKLKAEVDGFGGLEPTWEELKDMRYLNMCIKESASVPVWRHIMRKEVADDEAVLRMYPSVSTNSRAASKDTVLPVGGGPDGKSPIFVPKGSTLRWSTYAMHRRQDIFGPDAEEFRPERWEDLRVS